MSTEEAGAAAAAVDTPAAAAVPEAAAAVTPAVAPEAAPDAAAAATTEGTVAPAATTGPEAGAAEKTAAPAKVGSNQEKYGNELPIPSTYARCGRCQASFALTPEDLGTKGKGCRVACNLCTHSWYQSRDKLFTCKEGFELEAFLESDIKRIRSNIEAGRRPNFVGVSKLYVGNLDFKCTEADIIEMFSAQGEVGEANIVRDQETGRSRGFAFVTMMTEEGGEKSLALDGEELLGRNLQVRQPNN